jgi:uncharacterized DUF497 family protein
MRYEWDEAKKPSKPAETRRNLVRIGDAGFEDERCLVYADRIDSKTEEQRWHAVGLAQLEPAAGAVLLVVHVYREDHRGEEIIRIVSARAAEKHEIRRYQEQALD